MINLRTFIVLLFFVLSLLAAAWGSAAPANYIWTGPGGKTGSDPSSLCLSYNSFYPSSTYTLYIFTPPTYAQCKSVRKSDGYTELFNVGRGSPSCPDGSIPDLTKPENSVCPEPPPKCKIESAGLINITTAYASGPGAGAAIVKKIVADGAIGVNGESPSGASLKWCRNSCVISPAGAAVRCGIDKVAGPNGYNKITCDVPMIQTGDDCHDAPGGTPAGSGPNGATPNPLDVGGEPAGPPPEQNKCPAGSVPSGLDRSGMTICMGNSPAGTPPAVPKTTTTAPTVTTTAPDGKTTATSATTVTNTDGSKTVTTTTTVTAPDGVKSVTVASDTTKPDGTKGVDDNTKADPKSDLCKQNPALAVCRNSQVVGTCKAIACEGDAIQCATLKQAAEMNCRAQDDVDVLKASPLTTLGGAVAAGTDPIKSTLPTVGNGANIAMPSSLDGSGWLGGGACFADKTMVVQGRTILIPLSKSCEYLIVLRYVMMIVALLVSFKILSGAIIRE